MMKQLLFCFLLFLSASCSRSSPKYTVGIDPSFYPLDLMGKEVQVLGFVNELLAKVAEENSLKLYILKTNPENLMLGLHKKIYEGAFSSLEPQVFIEKDYDFSDLI